MHIKYLESWCDFQLNFYVKIWTKFVWRHADNCFTCSFKSKIQDSNFTVGAYIYRKPRVAINPLRVLQQRGRLLSQLSF